MFWGYNVLVVYIDVANIGNGRYEYQLSVYQLLRNTVFVCFPVFNPYVMYFRLLKKIAEYEVKYFKKSVNKMPFLRYITVHANYTPFRDESFQNY